MKAIACNMENWDGLERIYNWKVVWLKENMSACHVFLNRYIFPEYVRSVSYFCRIIAFIEKNIDAFSVYYSNNLSWIGGEMHKESIKKERDIAE